jgi:polygalacturonase
VQRPTHRPTFPARLAAISCGAAFFAVLGCEKQPPITPVPYTCGETGDSVPDPSTWVSVGDPADCPDVRALEPKLPAIPSNPTCILIAGRHTDDQNWIPEETNDSTNDDTDTKRIQTALNSCPVVQLTTDPTDPSQTMNSFVSGPLTINGRILWIDKGVTLFASRNPDYYQANATATSAGDCAKVGVNDSSACTSFITVNGASPGIVGEGTIDGQGGELLVNHAYSWWQLSAALQTIDGSIGNPTLVDVRSGVTNLLIYKITLHNSPKFHVKITSTPAGGIGAACTSPGAGFIVWGVTILTPSRWLNMQGLPMSPHASRNTDGIDPGETSFATCGLLAYNTISTGDDHIAIKGGHGVSNILVVHNHFGTGHGMSIGSETYGGVDGLQVCDLTIDADSRPVGDGASPGDFNGIRVKSDASRGGTVTNASYKNICMRDVNNSILMSTAYNPLFSGTMFPQFSDITFQNIRDVTCMGLVQPVVTLNGFSALYPATNIGLDNVIVDWTGPEGVSAMFSQLNLGPDNVNFAPYISGQGVSVNNGIVPPGNPPITCVFPKLPAPQPPPGWLN